MDSDDDCPPCKVSSTRGLASLGPRENAPSQKTNVKNEDGVLKRKRGSYISTGGNDNRANDNARDVDDSSPTNPRERFLLLSYYLL